MKNEKKSVMICGFKQNCYKIGTSTGLVGIAQKPNVTQLKYESLEKQMLPNGYVETMVTKDYPINSASVTSYADGADYRNDPAQAVASAPNRVNLGDVSQVQKFAENPQNSQRIFDDVKAKLEAYFKAQASATPKQVQDDNSKKEGDK